MLCFYYYFGFFLFVCLSKTNKHIKKKEKKRKKEQNLDKECSQKICASDHDVKEEEIKKTFEI